MRILTVAAAVLETIHASGCNAGAAHAQMYTMGTVLRHGSEEQKNFLLPKIASGEARLQAFGVSEPNNGTDTMRSYLSRVMCCAFFVFSSGISPSSSLLLFCPVSSSVGAHSCRIV